jgi:YfiH family protein
VATDVHSSFDWRRGGTGLALHATALDRVAPHIFTTRERVFRGPDASADYAQLAKHFEVPDSAVVTVSQVHGRAVLTVRPGLAIEGPTDADAIVSFDPDRVIAVRVADCVPILIGDRGGRAVAAIHAGWRGTCAGVAGEAVGAMKDAGIDPGSLVAALGPSIGACCYQVDDRVRLAFLSMTPDAAAWFTEDGPGRWRLDLWQANRDQLEDAGLLPEHISVSEICTADHLDRCFSYRKEGAATGRMVAAVRLRTPAG